MRRTPRAYVAGPYRAASEAEVYDNIHNARMTARRLRHMGYHVYCPHMNSAFEGSRIVSEDQFLEEGLAFLAQCDLLVSVSPHWQSAGTNAEVAFAREHGIPVYLHRSSVHDAADFWTAQEGKGGA